MSTRITTGMLSARVLGDLNRVSERLTKTQSKIASGKEIERPSDDPFGVSRAMVLRENLDGVRQFQRNVHDATGWQEATELALANITNAAQRARELLVAGANGAVDASARASIADEVEQLIESVKQSANATYRGRFLFAGTDTSGAPYLAGATDAYQGDGGMIARQVGPGVSLEINVLGSTVLGSGAGAPPGGDGKLLHVLRDIAADLRAGNTASLSGSDLARLDANLDAMLGVRSFNGARTNRLDSALGRLAEVEEATVRQLSLTEDADIAKTLIDLNSQQAAYQAALRAGANIVQSSLMDFLR